MPLLSIKELDLLHRFDMSDEGIEEARLIGLIKPDGVEEFATALHESAHFCAAVVVKSYITEVRVTHHKRGRPSQGVVGSCEPLNDARFDVFVSLAGREWELLHTGIAAYGADDLERAQREAREASQWRGVEAAHVFNEVQQATRAFVYLHEVEIRKVAAGILALRNKQGYLCGRRIWALADWVRPQLPPSFDAVLACSNLCNSPAHPLSIRSAVGSEAQCH